MAREACYHARYGKRPAPRYGQRVTVITVSRRGVHPRNVLLKFSDGERAVTSIGCLRWTCDKHP